MVNTFSALWDELKTEALNAWESVKNEAVYLEHTFVPILEQDIVLVLSQFKGLAVNIIMTLAKQEFDNLTGGQKNIITVQTILSAAASGGKEIALQDAQILAQ